MKLINSLSQALLLGATLAAGTPAVLADEQDLTLEPCINGGVSATGRFESQAIEDKVLRGENEAAISNQGIGSGADDVISAFGGHRDDFLR